MGVKIPEDQKEMLEMILEERGYTSKSEYIRELLRKDMERYLVMREEIAEELKRRKQEVEEGDLNLEELETTEEVFEEVEG